MRQFALTYLFLLVTYISASNEQLLGTGAVADGFLRGDHYQRRLNVNTSWVPWGQKILGTTPTELFGDSVSLSASGMVLAVGAPNGGTNSRGYVRLFQFALGSNWTQAGRRIDGVQDLEMMGSAMDLSGDGRRIVLGMPLSDKSVTTIGPNGATITLKQIDAGRVAVWEYVANDWFEFATSSIPGMNASDEFGFAVAMSDDGKRIAASAINTNGTAGNVNHAGSVQIYDLVSTPAAAFRKVGQTIHGTAVDELFGYSLDLSSDGMIVAIGNGATTPASSHVQAYKYDRSNKTWAAYGKPIQGRNTALSLSSDGQMIAVGYAFSTVGTATQAGIVLVYAYNDVTQNWDLMGNVINGLVKDGLSGMEVVLSSNGNRVMVQSLADVRQFEYNNTGNIWNQVGQPITATPTPDGTAMSSDGTKIAAADTATAATTVYQFPEQSYDLNLAWLGSTFDSSGKPEVEMKIINSAPRGAQGTGYYTMVVLEYNCAAKATEVIRPILDAAGKIPVAQVDVTTSSVTAQIDINTTHIRNSTYYVTDPDTKEDSIRFCTKTSFFDQGNTVAAASLTQRVTIVLDKVTQFSLADVDYGSTRPIFETFKYVGLDYPLDVFFCNSQNQEVVPTNRFPGQVVQICVKAPKDSPVLVEDVKNVYFKNDMVPLLKIDLINNEGKPSNDQTTKTCAAGLCNVRTIVFQELFENDVNNDGVLDDVSQGVRCEGSAILSFVGRRQLLTGNRRAIPFEKRRLQADMRQTPDSDIASAKTVTKPLALSDKKSIPITDFGIRIPLHQPPTRTTEKFERVVKSAATSPTAKMVVSVALALAALTLF